MGNLIGKKIWGKDKPKLPRTKLQGLIHSEKKLGGRGSQPARPVSDAFKKYRERQHQQGGSFGTDPATGNTLSKAKYEKANQRAGAASFKAATAGEHKKAAEAHRAAGIAAGKAGLTDNQKAHQATALAHHEMANKAGFKHPDTAALQKAHEVRVHNRSLARAGAIGTPEQQSKTIPDRHGVIPGEHVTPHAQTHAVSSHAHMQSIKANAKPSLASHSLAAKAHLAAAGHHPAGSGEHAAHMGAANTHQQEARNHSQRIMKLKKIGPGQHHGRGGRFEGTPGGAR